MKKILFSLLILFTITGCAIAQEPAPTVPKPFIGQFFVNISGGDTSVYVYKGGAYGWTKLLRARGTSVIDTLHTKKGVSVAGNLNVGGNLSITGSGSNTLGQVIIGGGDWYGQLQLRSDGGGTSGAGRIRFSNTHSAGLDYFIQQDNDPSASSLIISRGTPGGTVGVKITDKNIYDGDGVRFLKTGDVTGGGTTTNNLTAGNGIIGTAFNGASAQTWKADTSILQTVLNFFPKADTRYLKTSTAASTYQPIGSYALQSITISPGLGLTGGGSIAANRTITVDTTVLKSKVGFLTDYNNLSGRINAKQASLTGPGYVKMASGSPTYITSIPNADLAFSTITLNGASTALGGSFTVTKTNTDTTTTGFATRSLVSTYLTKAQIVAGYQPLLVSATNIKTVNSASLLGSGNLAITTANTDTTSTGFQTVSNFFPKADTRYLKISTASTTYTPLTRNINTSSGITGGGALSADLTLKSDTTFNRTVANSYTLAALQTKFNNYTLQTRNISTGLGLSGGGTLAADRTIIADTTVLKSKTGFLTDYNNLSTRINAKGVGSVTSVAAGLGMSFTTITGAGSVIADTTVLRTVANSKSLAQLQTAFNLKANLASPALTGTPTAPTQATADNSTAIATTAYVQANFTASTVYFSPGTFSGAGTSGSPYAITLTTTGTSGAATFASGVLNIPQYSGGGATGASPTASLGLTAINGSATTFMRSDAAPALSQSIAPTWTGIHTFQTTNTASSGTSSANYGTLIAHIGSQTSTAGFTDVLVNSTGTFGSGTHNLLDLQVSGTSKFSISNTGQILSSAGFNGGNITSGSFNTTVNTSYNSIFLTNYAPADATHQSLYGPNTIWNFPVWNTTSTTQNYINWKQEARGSGGATPGTTWVLSSSLTTTTTASYTDRLSLDGLTGNLTLSGGLITGGHSTIEGITSTGATGTGKFVFDSSPALTGTPTVPTASPGTNTTQAASTAFVTAAVAAGGGATGASPTASLGLTAINGSATTFMRSDAAPALSQSIAPTWTGIHTWNVNNLLTATSDIIFVNNTTASTNVNTVQVSPSINIGGTYWTGSASNAMNYRITAGNLFGNQFTISGQTNGGTWKDLLYIDPFGAFISKSQFTIQLSNTGTTPTEGLILQSTTASSAGSPVQWSGRTRFISRVWNTTATAADNQLDFTNEVRPVSGTTPTGKMFWASRLSVSGSGSFVDNMSLDNSGNLRVGTITTSPLSLSAINATATATAAQVAIGYITSTSASATTITLPTATALATQLGAVRGTQFQFTIDNTLGASTVTLALGTGFTQLSILTGANTLTVASGATGVGVWEITFVSTTAATISRVE